MVTTSSAFAWYLFQVTKVTSLTLSDEFTRCTMSVNATVDFGLFLIHQEHPAPHNVQPGTCSLPLTPCVAGEARAVSHAPSTIDGNFIAETCILGVQSVIARLTSYLASHWGTIQNLYRLDKPHSTAQTMNRYVSLVFHMRVLVFTLTCTWQQYFAFGVCWLCRVTSS